MMRIIDKLLIEAEGWNVLYILSYKGKTLGQPMDLLKAEAVLKQMSHCFKQLQIIPYHPKSVEPDNSRQQTG
ncbi:hypothetical protein [Paenibacillus cremeus]|uniref:Uncharacterized protein n=1 Tax=Paenibacillus cremeus TaxID=2163881 RepID=A0A559KFE4_9BACL|nr:hypothetical protein [Paenibacillus cremeus]TVY10828.1 hypothetical protein FPZ49_06955 [Paenibacillus cremeus]